MGWLTNLQLKGLFSRAYRRLAAEFGAGMGTATWAAALSQPCYPTGEYGDGGNGDALIAAVRNHHLRPCDVKSARALVEAWLDHGTMTTEEVILRVWGADPDAVFAGIASQFVDDEELVVDDEELEVVQTSDYSELRTVAGKVAQKVAILPGIKSLAVYSIAMAYACHPDQCFGDNGRGDRIVSRLRRFELQPNSTRQAHGALGGWLDMGIFSSEDAFERAWGVTESEFWDRFGRQFGTEGLVD